MSSGTSSSTSSTPAPSGLLVGGARPAEGLHVLYAVLAVGAVPLATSLAVGRPARRRALPTLSGALVALVLIARLFATG